MYWAGRPYLLESDSLYNGQAAHHLYAVCLSVCLSTQFILFSSLCFFLLFFYSFWSFHFMSMWLKQPLEVLAVYHETMIQEY